MSLLNPSSVLKYIDNCDVESATSKSLCFNLISSGIDEFMYSDIFCFASSLDNPDTSIPFIDIPFIILSFFELIIVNVQKIINDFLTYQIEKVMNDNHL